MSKPPDAEIDAYLDLLSSEPELVGNQPDGIAILTELAEIHAAQEEARTTRAANGYDVSDLRVGLLAHDPYMTVVRDAVRFPDGTLGLHNRVFEKGSVAVLPLLDGQPVMIEIFRHGLRGWSLEFPRGAGDPGESNEETVRRELREEIGAEVLELMPLGRFTPGGASLSIISDLFAARIDRIGEPQQSEAISSIRVLSREELERSVETGEIIDGFSLAIFARARVQGIV